MNVPKHELADVCVIGTGAGGGVMGQELTEAGFEVHGGNRDYGGWKWVGYPGPRHSEGGYTPAQMLGKAPIRPIWQ